MRIPLLLVSLALLGVLVPGATAQVALDRTPNLGGTWVPDPSVVRFDFLHRFWVTPGPNSSVINYPTFTLAAGFPARLAFGLRYATKGSDANETEIFARWRVRRGPVNISFTPAYNTTVESFDAEVGADWTRGAVTLAAAVRGMSQAFGADRARAAAAAGAVIRLNDYVGIAGDFGSMLDPNDTEDPAWSAGLVFVIPSSPHTFSLHASSVGANTIQGSSRRDPRVRLATSKPLYGFEFTIPLHLGRFAPWFRGRSRPAATRPEPGVAVEVRMEGFKFSADTVTITRGQAVRWTNRDPLEHTVTFEAGAASSGLLATDTTFTVRFDRPGTYIYHCTPHPYMKGAVVVK